MSSSDASDRSPFSNRLGKKPQTAPAASDLARLEARLDNLARDLEMFRGAVGENAREFRHILAAMTLPDPALWQGLPAVAPAPPRGELFPTGAVCRQDSFERPEFAYWAARLGQVLRYHRKLWEFVFICQALWERETIRPGARGLGFGVGQEPLTAFFAGQGCTVTATDMAAEAAADAGWIATAEHASAKAALARPDLCPPETFEANVEFRVCDMNAVPEDLVGYDFCWSACALEHLGSIQLGLDFIERSVRTLKPGGWAVHTTELNLGSNDHTVDNMDTVLFRRRDLEALRAKLEAQGHRAIPIDYDPGVGPIDRYIDLPPYRVEPHLKLALWGYPTTSVGLMVQRGPA